MAQTLPAVKVYDVCVVGSGAAGGTAAKVLTEGGLNVVMLEAGPLLDPAKHYTEHIWPYELPHRGAGIGGRGVNASGSYELDVAHITSYIEGEPYLNAPGSEFRWTRGTPAGRPHESLELRHTALLRTRSADAHAARLWRRLAN